MSSASTGRCSTSGSVPPRASSRRKCDLPDPLEPSTATRSPNQTSRSNGRIRPVSSSCSQTSGPLAGPAALEPHLHLLLARALLRRSGQLELGQPGHRRLVAAGHPVVVGGLLAQRDDELLELLVLLVPAAAQLLEPEDAVLPSLVVRREAASVSPRRRPGRAGFEGDDPARGAGQQLAVVADEEHRLGRLQQLVLEPALGRHVEVVVRLVEHQHLVRAAEQRLQHQALLLAAGEGAHLAPLGPFVRRAERGHRADVEQRLRLVAPDVAPVGERLRVTHLDPLVVVLHHGQLGPVERARGVPDRLRRNGKQQIADGRVVAHLADELPHDAEAAGARDRAPVGGDVAGDDPQQRGLAGAVGPDQRDLGPFADPEGDLVQQPPAVRQVEDDGVEVDVAHGQAVCRPARSRANDFAGYSSSTMCTAASSADAAAPSMPTSPATRSFSVSACAPSSGLTRRPARWSPTSPS